MLIGVVHSAYGTTDENAARRVRFSTSLSSLSSRHENEGGRQDEEGDDEGGERGGGGDDGDCASRGKHNLAAAVAAAGLVLWAVAIFAETKAAVRRERVNATGKEGVDDPAEQQREIESSVGGAAAQWKEPGGAQSSPKFTLFGHLLVAPNLLSIENGTKMEDADADADSGSEREEEDSHPPWRGEELWYHDQLVDHFSPSNRECANIADHDEKKRKVWRGEKSSDDYEAKWSQRYYASCEHFRGPGHPIFLVVGGETDDMSGISYKFVADDLAKKFGAYTFQPEHRFYGKSQPLGGEHSPTVRELRALLDVRQVIADNARLARHIRRGLGCDPDDKRSSPMYCPLVAVGGSYPAVVAELMRIARPDVVDAAYSASAPVLGLPGFIDSNSYYDRITKVAEKASPGCPDAVKRTLLDVVRVLSSDGNEEDEGATIRDVAGGMGLCVDSIPEYMTTNALFSEEIMMLSGNIFAEYNMDFYPPNDDTSFVRACRVFQDDSLTTMYKMRSFFLAYSKENEGGGNSGEAEDKPPTTCFDLMTVIPDGEGGTISSSDWSGAGGGNDGNVWDFQGCYQINTGVGFSADSMFPEREWSLEWLTDHCRERFGIAPELGTLANEYGANIDLVARRASRILFTNGLNDGWSARGSVLEGLSDTIVALNFPNGSHHSDLTYNGPVEDMTDDVREGRIRVAEILGEWLGEIRMSEM